jgi:hypothetical protein
MPELDYMVLADYVRQDAGTTHIMGAGIDTITSARVPAEVPVGIALRVTFDSLDEIGAQDQLTLIFQGADERLMQMAAPFVTPPPPPGVPEHWKTGVGMALRILLPVPSYGDYSLELLIDDEPVKSIDLRAMPQEAVTAV